MLVAALRNAEKCGLASGTVLAWHEPQGRSKIAARPVLTRIPRLSGEYARSDRPDSRYCQQTLGNVILFHQSVQFAFYNRDLLVEVKNVIPKSLQQGDEARRQVI